MGSDSEADGGKQGTEGGGRFLETRALAHPPLRALATVCPCFPHLQPPKPSLPVRVAAAAAALVIAATPAPALAGDVVLGAKVFSNTCAACHAGGQNIVEPDKTLDREALETYLAGGFSEASIVKQASRRGGARPSAAAAARLARAPVLRERPRVWALPVLRGE